MHSLSKIIILLLTGFQLHAQVSAPQVKHVLFLGNSYTYVNNLPQMLADMALSTGDTLIFDSNLPGGYTLNGHSTNPTSQAKIMQGGFDYVVLQEQSQLPAFPINQMMTDCYPYAKRLNDSILAYNPCAETMFYMTWGRKNGDASNCIVWPPVCTYMGMDSLLRMRYLMLADSNDAEVAPAGAVWRYVRQQYPTVELYQTDESHPSPEGTYAAACAFYAAIFRKDPTLITYQAGLDTATTSNLRGAAKAIVYDSLANWFIGAYDPVAGFSYSISQGTQVTFTNLSSMATSFFWDFGDGDTSSQANPVHTYPVNTSYTVILTASHCNRTDSIQFTVNLTNPGINTVSVQSENLLVYPNPSGDKIYLNATVFDGKDLTVEIKNVLGQQVYYVYKKVNDSREMDISTLPHGLYFIQINCGDSFTRTIKLIRQ